MPHNAHHSQGSPVRLSWLLALLLVAAVATVFWAVGHYGFVAWDDDLHVSGNPRFQPVTWASLWAFWRAPYEHLYMPLTYSAWAALVWLSGALIPGPLNAGIFHNFNLVVHLCTVLVVYRVGLLVLGDGGDTTCNRVAAAATAGALVFGLHPLQVEAVAWVSGLKDVLCGWWALLAVWQYLQSVRTQRKLPSWSHYILALVAFCFALLTKPAAVVVPVIAGLLAVRGLGQRPGQAARSLAGWLILAGLWGIWTKIQQPDAILGYVTPWWERPVVAADAIAFYLGKLVWPVGLAADYGRTPQVVLGHTWGYLASLIPLGLGIVLWFTREKLKGAVLGAAVFVAALLPVLGMVPFIFQAYSTVADRYVYLALLGPALGLGWSLLKAGQQRSWWLVTALVLGLLGWQSMLQVQVWHDTVSLFSHTLQVNPRSALAHNNLGWSFSQQGQLEKAVWHYNQALQLRPTMLEAGYNLGDALAAQGKLDEAIAYYTWVLNFKPAWAEVHNNLGTALMERGNVEAAIAHYTQAMRAKPDWALPYNNMGDAMARQGKIEAAMKWFEQAMQLKPDLPEAPYNLAGLLRKQGRIAEAVRAYREAIRRRPNWPQAANNLAWLLTQQDNPSAQDATDAVALAELACQATGYRNPVALRTLAAAYYMIGKGQEAIQAAQHALTMARDYDEASLAAEISEQLQNYERTHAIRTHR